MVNLGRLKNYASNFYNTISNYITPKIVVAGVVTAITFASPLVKKLLGQEKFPNTSTLIERKLSQDYERGLLGPIPTDTTETHYFYRFPLTQELKDKMASPNLRNPKVILKRIDTPEGYREFNSVKLEKDEVSVGIERFDKDETRIYEIGLVGYVNGKLEYQVYDRIKFQHPGKFIEFKADLAKYRTQMKEILDAIEGLKGNHAKIDSLRKLQLKIREKQLKKLQDDYNILLRKAYDYYQRTKEHDYESGFSLRTSGSHGSLGDRLEAGFGLPISNKVSLYYVNPNIIHSQRGECYLLT